MILSPPSIDDVVAAADRIAAMVHRTPIATSSTLNTTLGVEVFFKLESQQKVGAFKARGAVNAVLDLDRTARSNGVITHSSGNHGQALAYAATAAGIACTVIMPSDAPGVKLQAVKDYGARVVLCDNADRQEVTTALQAETGATLTHPFDDPAVIAGQGTVCLEFIDQVPDLDVVVAPVGGGGLMSGTAIVARAKIPDAQLIGVEPEAVDDATRSLALGTIQKATGNQTWGDGLRTALSDLTFSIMRRLGVDMVTVAEEAIVEAALFHLNRMKHVVEPSGAVGLAALQTHSHVFAGKRVGVIVSGGNTDFRWLEAAVTGRYI